jgi:hypothetical protein
LSEQIFKLQPNRTVHLRGFDGLGASAAVYAASASGFTVSGSFQDAADFAVVVLYDADNFFEHPRLKYLPDNNFAGLSVQFDATLTNLMPWTSTKSPTIDWPYLDVIKADGSTAKIRLSDHATVVGAEAMPASTTFQISGDSLAGYDRVILWYENMAFPYDVNGAISCQFTFWYGDPFSVHTLTIGSDTYSYTAPWPAGASGAEIAAALAAQATGRPDVTVSVSGNVITITRALADGSSVTCSASDGNGSVTLVQVKATTVAAALAGMINGANYTTAPYALQASVSGTTITVSTTTGGYDANFVTMYAESKTSTLTASPLVASFTGGTSESTLRVTLDFSALGVTSIRKMWLTLAPRLAYGEDYAGAEWSAVFANWTVSGPDEVKYLKVAGPLSTRIEAVDARVDYAGEWVPEDANALGNIMLGTSESGASVSVRYYCSQAHELWVWTSLYGDRGTFAVTVDGVAKDPLNCAMSADEQLITRRRVATGLAAGDHVLTLASTGTAPVYFAGLDAAVRSDVPDALAAQTFMTPALDYSTDHSYKLPPARILWMLEQLGCTGPLNQYAGIFWWNQRKRVGAVMPTVTVPFSGTYAAGDSVFLVISDITLGKSVLLATPAANVAAHFAMIVNEAMVGVWAEVSGDSLILHARAVSSAYTYTVSASSNAGTILAATTLGNGTAGVWQVDPDATLVLNAGARAWHTDLYQGAAAAGRAVTTAFSMELVNPPAALAARFPDGAAATTSMSFGNLYSTHCALSSGMLAYQKRAFLEAATLMNAAGLTPDLQCGEFLWWYFTNYSSSNPSGGMAYYDDETAAAALAALGRPLHVFRTPADDPTVNASADATFLRNRLRDHAAALMAHVRASYPAARFEILYPYDVNQPTASGIHDLGGRLNWFVNLPPEWRSKEASAFDRFKIEALDYGVWSRDLDLARACMGLPLELGWPGSSVRAMIGVFRGGYPWPREAGYAADLGLDGVSLWAFDHVCLFGWNVADAAVGRAFRMRRR